MRKIAIVVAAAWSAICFVPLSVSGQTPASAKKPAKAWTAPKTGWGDPDLSGVYTNNDESLIPFERPAELAGTLQISHPPSSRS
jgi:hypothetical protein